MGRYIDTADLVERYREVGKEIGFEEVSSAYIYYAEHDVDMHLGAVYTAPFSSNNLTAKDLSIDFAYVRMSRRARPKDAEAIHSALMKTIEKLTNGTLSMVTTSGDLLRPSLGAMDSTTKLYNPLFILSGGLPFKLKRESESH